MNEEALKDAYGLFTNTGYNGTQDEFYTLLSDNAEAFADSSVCLNLLGIMVLKMTIESCLG